MNYSEDGITHINIWSKGNTELGRFLSNFSKSPILTEDGKFLSIEGYWYWLGCKDDRLKTTVGFEAKKLGRELGAPDWLDGEIFKDKICKAITTKIYSNKDMLLKLKNCTLPLTHYYVYGGKQVLVPEANWIIEHIENVRKGL